MSVLFTAAESTTVYGLTTGRLIGTVAALLALAGVVIGWLALTRSTGNRKKRSVIALVAGLAGMAVGGGVVAAAKGGPGAGYGIVGGYAALVIGLIAAALGWVALARSRRTV